MKMWMCKTTHSKRGEMIIIQDQIKTCMDIFIDTLMKYEFCSTTSVFSIANIGIVSVASCHSDSGGQDMSAGYDLGVSSVKLNVSLSSSYHGRHNGGTDMWRMRTDTSSQARH